MVHNASSLLSRDKQLASLSNCLLLVLVQASRKAKEVVKLDCIVPECIANIDCSHQEYLSHKY